MKKYREFIAEAGIIRRVIDRIRGRDPEKEKATDDAAEAEKRQKAKAAERADLEDKESSRQSGISSARRDTERTYRDTSRRDDFGNYRSDSEHTGNRQTRRGAEAEARLRSGEEHEGKVWETPNGNWGVMRDGVRRYFEHEWQAKDYLRGRRESVQYSRQSSAQKEFIDETDSRMYGDDSVVRGMGKGKGKPKPKAPCKGKDCDKAKPKPFMGYEEADPCWDGYRQEGMKSKGGRQVPNCVPVTEGWDRSSFSGLRMGSGVDLGWKTKIGKQFFFLTKEGDRFHLYTGDSEGKGVPANAQNPIGSYKSEAEALAGAKRFNRAAGERERN